MPDDVGSNPANENFAPHLVRLQQTGLAEAQLIKLKLEAEGIPSFIGGQNASVAYPLAFSTVELLVADVDLERANEILARPAQPDMEGEYADENWRCPRCHRKPVELLPLSAGQLGTRTGCLVVFFLPLLAALIGAVMRDQSFDLWVNRLCDQFSVPWAVALMVLTIVIVLGKRKKKCPTCGFQWKHGEDVSATEPEKDQ